GCNEIVTPFASADGGWYNRRAHSGVRSHACRSLSAVAGALDRVCPSSPVAAGEARQTTAPDHRTPPSASGGASGGGEVLGRREHGAARPGDVGGGWQARHPLVRPGVGDSDVPRF